MILTGHDDAVASWAAERLGTTFIPPYQAIGIVRNDELVGAAIFSGFEARNIEMSAVGRGAWTRSTIRDICRYCFETCNCRRITVRTKAGNTYVRHVFERFGAQHEGTLRHYYDDDDCMIYGLLKEDCKFL